MRRAILIGLCMICCWALSGDIAEAQQPSLAASMPLQFLHYMEVDLQTLRDELSTWNHDLTERATSAPCLPQCGIDCPTVLCTNFEVPASYCFDHSPSPG